MILRSNKTTGYQNENITEFLDKFHVVLEKRPGNCAAKDKKHNRWLHEKESFRRIHHIDVYCMRSFRKRGTGYAGD